MKKLQSNFTTPEQSRRLLELGVPAGSADCVFRRILSDGGYVEYWDRDIFDFIGDINDDYLPCWSVGRLIEIYEIVGKEATQCISTKKSCTRIENLVRLYEENALLLDFSKLED